MMDDKTFLDFIKKFAHKKRDLRLLEMGYECLELRVQKDLLYKELEYLVSLVDSMPTGDAQDATKALAICKPKTKSPS